MRVEKILFEGMMVNILVVEEGDEPVPCENCGGNKFDHPLLAREVDADWCLNCNDEAMGLEGIEYANWIKEQAELGKIIFVAAAVEDLKWLILQG